MTSDFVIVIMINFRIAGIVIALTGLMLTANAHSQDSKTMKLRYDIGFLNNTGHRLDNVDVYYGNVRVAAAGILVKTGRATYGSVTNPIPTEAEVRWNENGARHAVNVKLEGVVPMDFTNDDTIYLVINTNHTVDVKPIKFGDTEAVVKLEKSVRPEGEYRLGFVNRTGHDLQDVSVYYGGQIAGAGGDILARVKVGYSDVLTSPFPSEAELRWGENGTSHTVKVKLEGAVPKDYADGTIFFIIKGDDTVVVKPVKWSDSQGSVNLVK